MPANAFSPILVDETADPVEFVTNILQVSSAYSIIGKGLNGATLLWHEGARRPD